MKYTVSTCNSSYQIIIEKGILDNLNKVIGNLGKVLIVSDDGVPSIYIDKVCKQIPNSYVYIIPQGENSKSIENYILINKKLLELNFSRNDTLIALGGGVVGDLTGFVASTYKRGIAYIQIPTTTLSQIDSSVGGKTAIDLLGYKNVVGSFYQPKLVLIDVNVLKTLPARHYYNGLVEALKIGLIFDEELVNLFEKENIEENIEEIIAKAVYLKKVVVEQDERETHLRKVLNFGHTIGHAIESCYLGEILHGECVAKGMIPFIKDVCLQKRVLSILEKMNVIKDFNKDEDRIYYYLKNDKKADLDKIDVIYIDSIGKYRIEKLLIRDLLELVKVV